MINWCHVEIHSMSCVEHVSVTLSRRGPSCPANQETDFLLVIPRADTQNDFLIPRAKQCLHGHRAELELADRTKHNVLACHNTDIFNT